MVLLLVSLGVLGGLTWYMTEPWERIQAVHAIRAAVERVARRGLGWRRQAMIDPALHARARVLVVTPALALAQVVVFLGVVVSTVPADDPTRLLHWGASVGTKTTNGEWWRLLTANFVHGGAWHLAVNLAALIALGRVLERVAGPAAFACTFICTSIIAGIAGLAARPVEVLAGASAGIAGLYGLLIATWLWGALQRAETTVRLRTAAKLAPFTVGYVVYHTRGTGAFDLPEQLAAGAGLAGGLILCRRAAEGWSLLRPVLATAAGAVCVAMLAAVPLRGIADIGPELSRIVTLEDRHTEAYDRVIEQVTGGRASRGDAAALIEETIVPDLVAARSRLDGLARVPREHAVLVKKALDYLQLRERSWRLRADGNRRSSAAVLREADAREQEARSVLRQLEG